MWKKVEQYIATKEFIELWKKTTICFLTLDNWFEVVGTSACVKKEDFDVQIWQQYAYQNALDKLEELYWFAEHLNKE